MKPNVNQQQKPQFAKGTPDWAKPMLIQAQQKYGVPAAILSAQIMHESGFNPVARGQNTDASRSVDRGIAQINSHWHPEVTDQQADNPSWAINWMASTMADKFQRHGDWAKALSEYNTGSPDRGIGTYARAVLNNVPGMENQGMSQAQPDVMNNATMQPMQQGTGGAFKDQLLALLQQFRQRQQPQQALANVQAPTAFQGARIAPQQTPSAMVQPSQPKQSATVDQNQQPSSQVMTQVPSSVVLPYFTGGNK